jgi:hypothetical protein
MIGAILEVSSDLLPGLSQHPPDVISGGLFDGIIVTAA